MRSEWDNIAPGGAKDYHIPLSYRGGFVNEWDARYAKRPGYAWNDNRFVFAASFRRLV